MRLFRTLRDRANGVELDSDSASSASPSDRDSETGGSAYSDDSFNAHGVPSTRRVGSSAYSGTMRRPASVRSQSSARGVPGAADSSGRRTPPAAVSPRGFSQGTHLRSLSNGGQTVPVAYAGGSLVPLGRGGVNADSRNMTPRGPNLQLTAPVSVQAPLNSSMRSMNASMAFSQYMASAMMEKRPTMNILVIGAPQVGKSMFINAYRATVTNSLKWPTAPVGICGFYGTTSVEPFPNHPTEPSWMCVDTPGRFYDGEYEFLLEKLVEGIPWKTKLVGQNAMPLSEVKELIPIAANAAHQCVIVIPATDLIEDLGWSNVLRLRNRYGAAADACQVVLYLKGVASVLRALLKDTAPFVFISKMDRVGGCSCYAAKEAILSLVGQCLPVNRVFFGAFPESSTALSFKQTLTLDSATRENLIQMHEEICYAVQWKRRVNDI